MGIFFTKDIAVLDVTSRNVSAIIGNKKAQSVFNIKAICEREHAGYGDGEWFDAENTCRAAAEALNEALTASGTRAKKLFIGVPAEFVAVVSKKVSVTLDRSRRVIDADVDYLYKKGETFADSGYVVINSSAVEFSVDTSDKVYTDVRGMVAGGVSAVVSYMLCDASFVSMFDAVAAKAGFKDVKYIAAAWAEGLALFEKEERDNTYVLVDVGYISSSIAVGRGEGLIDLKSFSLGGGHIAADIFEYLEVPFQLAEEAASLVDLNLGYADDAILAGSGDSVIYAAEACEIVRAKLDVFARIISDVLSACPEYSPSYVPIYLTGEGIASIRGAKKYLSERLGKNVETVFPKLAGYNKPCNSSRISLLTVSETLAGSGMTDMIKSFQRR